MSYNIDQEEGVKVLGEDENSLQRIPTTDLPSTTEGQEEVMFVPNSSNIRDNRNKRRDPLRLCF